jgi:hypothetical protein
VMPLICIHVSNDLDHDIAICIYMQGTKIYTRSRQHYRSWRRTDVD